MIQILVQNIIRGTFRGTVSKATTVIGPKGDTLPLRAANLIPI